MLKRSYTTKYILPLFLIGCLGAAAIVCWNLFAPLKAEQIVLRVNSGDNAGTIASKLQTQGIIRSSTLFKILAKVRGTDRRLIAGTYSIGGNNSLYKSLLLLEKGNTSAVRITFPEGLSLYKTLQKIDASGLAEYDSLYAIATDPVFVLEQTGFHVKSLEGFLYPETYAFDISLSAREILTVMAEQFRSKLQGAGIDPKTTPDFYDKLTLASIVEKESGNPDESNLIAGVMLNRLNKGMRLQSCPTVDYVLEKQGIKRQVLTLADTNIQSPYNTYVSDGLPPSPICNPSLLSLQAVLKPVKTDYLFFVANRKGRNDFSVTAEEHYRKIRMYRRSDWE